MTDRETNAPTPATGKPGKKSAAPQWLGSAIEFAPLGAFLVTWLWSKDLMAATVVVMVASALAVLVSYLVHRKIPWMPLMTAMIVGVFGGLTLYLADESFIKMKPTMINTLFAAILFGMLALGKLPLKKLLGHAFEMPDSAWKTLTVRTGLFFLITAILNEAVWRTQPTEVWVYFKFPGLTVLTIGYFLLQIPFIMRHADQNQTS
ncbi:septation protein IspZ [Rhodospirillaceae bacterium KN72]|uniref:Inner membrane-spanning protein YciB n=1 Tax=Pacificispira spongiicola TaxID=2729598 RepID=A0A7Y0DZM5_9PROT|nr:inner membrane-spanning protein YciB [Pacificispira spongiicola]NMM44520.1 septation protein IspZ [Pacificispira spongiicola]